MELIYGQDNTYPPIEATLRKAATKEAIDLTGASVNIEIKDTSGTLVVDSTCAITESTAGRVRYTVESSLTETTGRYLARFVVTLSSGGVADIPNDEYFKILVKE